MGDLTIVLALVLFVVVMAGTLQYNKLRRKWARIMGVFGAYVIFLGILLLVGIIASLCSLISGNKDAFGAGAGETIFMVIIMVVCLGYMVICIMKCSTTKEKLMLPFAACMIAAGFCWRLIGSIVFHTPMSDGSEESSDEFDMNKLPNIIYDDANNRWQLQHRNGDSVVYHNDAGQMVTIYAGQISGSGAVTSAGNFHWY
ncbi:MAG: hypothetical protein K2I96_01810 [Lachnospiraceae bacterium]|nr:hypothetical protein [Lachnospiraceae bacterium]